MPISDIFLIVALLLGALQGMVYGSLLIGHNGKNKFANRILATILFFFAYRLIVETLYFLDIGLYDTLYHVLLEYNWIYGPLIYFYVKALITPNFAFAKRDIIHFVPVIIEFLWSNFIKTQNFYWDGTRESLSWLGYHGYIVWMHYPTMYLIATGLILFYGYKSLRLIKQQKAQIIEVKSERKWLKTIIQVLVYFALLVMPIVLVDFVFFDYAFGGYYKYPLFLSLAVITYWLGIQGYNKRDKNYIKNTVLLSKKESEELKQLSERLKIVMEQEHFYRDQDLSLNSLAVKLDTKAYLLSKCLNLVYEQKFGDYVNTYRIKELKALLAKGKGNDYTLLALAYEVGFNSKASFNRAVKKLTGKTPSELI